ncbi:inc metabolism membrane protein [Dimargaris cristalligena]|nr:inc metabolism membrane protein [Dimargaris cristalligena]
MSLPLASHIPIADVEMAILDRMEKSFIAIEARYRDVQSASKKRMGATLWLFEAKCTQSMVRHTYQQTLSDSEDCDSETSYAEGDDTDLDLTDPADANEKEAAQPCCTVVRAATLAEKADAAVMIMEDWLADLETQSVHRFYATVQYVEAKYAEFAVLDSFRSRIEGVLAQVEHKFVVAGSSTRDATFEATRAAFIGARRLLKFEELPIEWQENEFITSGYRFLRSNSQCLGSIFQFHNETGNIWTHLLGLMFFVVLAIYEIGFRLPSLAEAAATISTTSAPAAAYLSNVAASVEAHLNSTGLLWVDQLIFLFFFVAACKCLLCSTMYHTFCHHSHLPTMRCAVMLDYIGISFLITASIVTVEYYGFYCGGALRNFYLFFTIAVGITGVVLSSFPWFDFSEYRYIRVTVFSLMAASGFIPMVHLASDRGLALTVQFIAPVVKSLLCYGTGVYFYANKYPERLWPGLFDHIGNSHQLWHMAVIGGIYYHYNAALHFFNNRYAFGCLA